MTTAVLATNTPSTSKQVDVLVKEVESPDEPITDGSGQLREADKPSHASSCQAKSTEANNRRATLRSRAASTTTAVLATATPSTSKQIEVSVKEVENPDEPITDGSGQQREADKPSHASSCQAKSSDASNRRATLRSRTASTSQTSAVALSTPVLNSKRRRSRASTITTPNQSRAARPRFNCSLCDRSFANANYVQVHEKCYHAETPLFACAICAARFKYITNLSTHVNASHRK